MTPYQWGEIGISLIAAALAFGYFIGYYVGDYYATKRTEKFYLDRYRDWIPKKAIARLVEKHNV